MFDKIDRSLLKDENDQYYKAGGDTALLYGLFEACPADQIGCIQRVLVEYNDLNTINDYKANPEEQNTNAAKIRNARVNNIEQHNGLPEIVDLVRKKDPEAITFYKEAIASRSNVWIDDTDSIYILPRKQWMLNKIRSMNLPKDASILDIGSWTGKLIDSVYQEGYHDITCVDISKRSVELGRQTYPMFKWICGDVETIELQNKYDVITIMEVVEHLINPFDTLNKLKQMLKPNGRILYTIPTEDTNYGDGSVIHSEHVSLISEKDMRDISNDMEILQSDGYFKWYAGSITDIVEEKKTMPRILIAMPTAKYIEPDTFKSIYDLEKPEGCTVDFQYFFGYNIAQIRNLIAHYSVTNNYDYVLWVDSDIVLPAHTLIKMLSSGKDIVSGAYIQRIPGEKNLELYDFGSEGTKRLTMQKLNASLFLKIAGCGFGCVLTSTKVLKAIKYPQFEYHNAIDHNNTLSEDVDFCLKARAAGYEIYVDTTIRCNHIGNTVFSI